MIYFPQPEAVREINRARQKNGKNEPEPADKTASLKPRFGCDDADGQLQGHDGRRE